MSPLILATLILAQNRSENYPDIPQNHFVYDALKRFKSEGFLPEYPDQLFRGNRPFLRFEIAQFIVHVELNIAWKIGDPYVSEPNQAAAKEKALAKAKSLKEDVDILQKITPIFANDFPKFVSGQEIMLEQEEFATRMDAVIQGLATKP